MVCAFVFFILTGLDTQIYQFILLDKVQISNVSSARSLFFSSAFRWRVVKIKTEVSDAELFEDLSQETYEISKV